MISEIRSKLQAITAFVSKTNGIYERASTIQDILSRADTEMNKVVYDPVSKSLNFTAVDRQWILDFEEAKREVVIEKLKADGLTEAQLKEAEELGFTADEVLVAWEEMKEQEIKRADLYRMKLLGYDFGKTVQVWKSLDGKEDHRFFACLIKSGKENYRVAFEIDPNDLSDQMTLVMAEYARNLLDQASKEAFIDFNNAILISERAYVYEYEDGTRIDSNQLYRDVYLQRMYAGSMVMLQLDTARLVGMEMEYSRSGVKPEGYEQAYEEYRRKMDFSGYWASQSLLVTREGSHMEDNQFRIDDLVINQNGGQGLDYQLGYYSPVHLGWQSETIDAGLLNESQIKDAWNLETLKALQKQKDDLWANTVTKALEGTATVLALAYAAPEASILLSLFQMAKNGSAGTVVGLDRLISSEVGKVRLKETNVVLQNAINFGLQMYALEGKLTQTEKKIMVEWAGAGELYQVGGEYTISFYGLYNPKSISNFYRLQEEGLGEMAGWSSLVTDKLADDIRTGKMIEQIQNEELWPVCADILTGKYQMIKKKEEEYEINDVQELLEAFTALDGVLKFNENYPLPSEGIHKSFFQ